MAPSFTVQQVAQRQIARLGRGCLILKEKRRKKYLSFLKTHSRENKSQGKNNNNNK